MIKSIWKFHETHVAKEDININGRSVSCAELCDCLPHFRAGGSESGDQGPGPGGVRWQYFSEAGYIAGDRLRGGEDKYARNKFNQVSDVEIRVSADNDNDGVMLSTLAWNMTSEGLSNNI